MGAVMLAGLEPLAYASAGPLIPHRTDFEDDHDPRCGHLITCGNAWRIEGPENRPSCDPSRVRSAPKTS
ncbi:hypothetical protein FG87_19560 [Nocardia vulneris]|uniref:Uncharacterized protein n=1 Tax=Nocardia vulneris TaxID=1141657 RepID=A0ABR4ZE94_9NOCA|nr:hypothetical protein FG87_19560 [Nocardia vulneris]